MKEKFWQLPKEKQDRIINAGMEIFAKHAYKKAPMSEIADAAGISKSLLFHYFTNKKELYLFLYDYGVKFLQQKMAAEKRVESCDYFDLMEEGLLAKCRAAREYTYMNQFLISAYFENEPQVKDTLAEKNSNMLDDQIERTLQVIDQEKFKEGLDLTLILKELIWFGEGYMYHQLRTGNTDVDQWERDMLNQLRLWKQAYYKSS